jgi:hypothetical protein
LVEFFEFRHLTFQEFLTARAMVEGWHPGRKEDDTLSSVLEPHLVEEPWREVIPLAAVLGGKSTEVLIQTLTEYVGQITSNEAPLHNSIVNTLVNCLADEAAARPETIRAAIRALVRVGTTIASVSSTPILARGRYGPDLRDEAGRAFLSSAPIDADAADALTAAVFWQTLQSEDGVGYARAAEKFVSMLGASMVLTRCEGATALGRLCHELRTSENDDALTACVESLRRAGPILLTMTDGAPTECAASSFALAPIAYTRLWTPPADSDIYGRLFRLWQGHDDPTVRRLAAHALASQAPLLVNERPICASIPFSEVEDLMRRYDEPKESYEQPAVLFLAWCLRALDDTEIAKRASTLVQYRSHNVMGRTLRELSEHLNGPHSTDY